MLGKRKNEFDTLQEQINRLQEMLENKSKTKNRFVKERKEFDTKKQLKDWMNKNCKNGCSLCNKCIQDLEKILDE